MSRIACDRSIAPWVRLAVSVVLLCLLSGCQSVERWGTAGEDFAEPGVTLRDEIYRRYGLPLYIYDRPDGAQTLVYSRSRTNRMDFGIRLLFAQFSLASGRSQTESLFVDLARDDRVISVRRYNAPASPGWTLWPFGKGSDGT
jgi:hypothetical protein